jgi:signal peptide peptidase SppA
MNLKVIQFFGGVSRVSIDLFTWELMGAMADSTIDGIVLFFRSGGGTSVGTPETYRLVERCATLKPIVSYTDYAMCSAAYYIGCAAKAIYASPTAILGSVGVYAEHYDYEELYKKQGIEHFVFRAGERKARTLDGQIDDAEKQSIQDSVNKLHKDFVAAVQYHRPNVSDENLQGQCFDGTAATENSLADGLFDSIEELIYSLITTNQGEAI